jgi:hypothetical protein
METMQTVLATLTAESHKRGSRLSGACDGGSAAYREEKDMGLSWQQGPLSTGAIGRFLVPDPLPKRRFVLVCCPQPIRVIDP